MSTDCKRDNRQVILPRASHLAMGEVTAMRAVARHVAKEQAAAMRGRVAQAALWSLYRYGAAS